MFQVAVYTGVGFRPFSHVQYENFVRKFNVKLGREDIFKPTIGNEKLRQDSNDNDV